MLFLKHQFDTGCNIKSQLTYSTIQVFVVLAFRNKVPVFPILNDNLSGLMGLILAWHCYIPGAVLSVLFTLTRWGDPRTKFLIHLLLKRGSLRHGKALVFAQG